MRFRTVGDATCTGAVESAAATVEHEVIAEIAAPGSPSGAPPGPTTASARPAWKTASARGTSDGAAAVRHRRVGRRRQVDPHRPPALRLEGDLRGPARGGRAHQPRARRRVHQPGAAHRRPAGRARAGHHHRRRLPLLRHPQAQVHHRRHPRAHPVHAQHGHRRLDRRPGARPGRRPQGRPRAVAPPRLPRVAAGDPAPGACASTRWTWSTGRRSASRRSRPSSAASP